VLLTPQSCGLRGRRVWLQTSRTRCTLDAHRHDASARDYWAASVEHQARAVSRDLRHSLWKTKTARKTAMSSQLRGRGRVIMSRMIIGKSSNTDATAKQSRIVRSHAAWGPRASCIAVFAAASTRTDPSCTASKYTMLRMPAAMPPSSASLYLPVIWQRSVTQSTRLTTRNRHCNSPLASKRDD
jgi:hypothetical protein